MSDSHFKILPKVFWKFDNTGCQHKRVQAGNSTGTTFNHGQHIPKTDPFWDDWYWKPDSVFEKRLSFLAQKFPK